jgi:hypothetical protein
MDWLTFIASVLQSLAWPLTVITLALIFRNAIKTLLSEIISVKSKWFEIGFDKRIEQVAREAERVLPEHPAPIQIRVSDAVSVHTGDDIAVDSNQKVLLQANAQERFLRLVDSHPAAAILESWLDLETDLRKLAEKHDIDRSDKLSTRQIAQELRERGVLDEETLNIFSKLRDLRNVVVHTRVDSITPNLALEYDQIVRRLITKLRQN